MDYWHFYRRSYIEGRSWLYGSLVSSKGIGKTGLKKEKKEDQSSKDKKKDKKKI
jgi:hypothetical protein